ncbi:MAG: phosphotransferase [Anaerolineae bacterium]|nr:phosphotransferase [Anaerolineae bacterium]
MKLKQPLAEGRTAEIYPWREGWVLKLFHTWVSEEGVQYETRIARAVCAAGLAVPQVGDIVEVEGRLGLEYERLDGKAMGEVMAAKPWMLWKLARQLADLHVTVHEIEAIKDIPKQHERLERKIQVAKGLPLELKTASLQVLAQMPTGKHLCHGDFHPLNILMTMDRPVIIDWVDATCGNPLADVARTAVLLQGVENRLMQAHTNKFTNRITARIKKWALRIHHRTYLKRYFELRPGGETEYRRWRPIVAAGRMSEDIPGLNDWLRQQVERGLKNPSLTAA